MTATPRDASDFDYNSLKAILADASTEDLYRTIVNAPFRDKLKTTFLFLGIIVLTLVDPETGTIQRVALSETELAKNTTEVSLVPFNEIKIPADHPENILAKAIKTNEPQDTTDWKFLFEPAMTPDQARINQASGGIAYSAVYPLTIKGGGALIFSYFQYLHEIGDKQRDFMENYAKIVTDRLNA